MKLHFWGCFRGHRKSSGDSSLGFGYMVYCSFYITFQTFTRTFTSKIFHLNFHLNSHSQFRGGCFAIRLNSQITFLPFPQETRMTKRMLSRNPSALPSTSTRDSSAPRPPPTLGPIHHFNYHGLPLQWMGILIVTNSGLAPLKADL